MTDALSEKMVKIEGWFTRQQAELLEPYVLKLASNDLIVELGTFQGKSTLFFAETAPQVRIITVDMVNFPWNAEYDAGGVHLLQTPLREEILRAGNIVQIVGKTDDVVKTFNWPINFMFIDCNHDYEFVKADIANWKRFVVLGGIISFHDYDPPHQGVIDAVTEWLNEDKDFELVEFMYSVAVVRRVAIKANFTIS